MGVLNKLIHPLAMARRKLQHRYWMGQHQVLVNGIPKAGTHMVYLLMQGLPKYRSYGRKTHYFDLNKTKVAPAKPNSFSEVRKRIRQCLPGEIMKTHLAYHHDLANLIQEQGIKHFLVVRDPRDVLVSLYHQWSQEQFPDLWPWRYFDSLPTEQERYEFLIHGWPDSVPEGFPSDVLFPNWGQRMQQFVGWLDCVNTFVVRYESWHSPESRRKEIPKLLAFMQGRVNYKEHEAYFERMERLAHPNNSPTFREGKVGMWREELSEDLQQQVHEVAATAIQALGYTVPMLTVSHKQEQPPSGKHRQLN